MRKVTDAYERGEQSSQVRRLADVGVREGIRRAGKAASAVAGHKQGGIEGVWDPAFYALDPFGTRRLEARRYGTRPAYRDIHRGYF